MRRCFVTWLGHPHHNQQQQSTHKQHPQHRTTPPHSITSAAHRAGNTLKPTKRLLPAAKSRLFADNILVRHGAGGSCRHRFGDCFWCLSPCLRQSSHGWGVWGCYTHLVGANLPNTTPSRSARHRHTGHSTNSTSPAFALFPRRRAACAARGLAGRHPHGARHARGTR